MSGYDDMARHVRDALEESEVQADGSCIIRPEHYLQLNADFEAWDDADDAKRDASPMIAEAGERERIAQIVRDYCRNGILPEPCGGSLDTADLAANRILDISTPATLDNTAVERAFKAGWDKCWCRDPDAPTACDGGRQAAWEAYATLTAKTEKAE